MTETLTAAEFRELQFLPTPQMKYRNQKTTVDGITFDSKKEADYYGKLLMLKKEGSVIDFKMQVKYHLIVNGIKICTYISDFDVLWRNSGLKVTDCKGFKTPAYQLKKRLMKACFGIDIKEV